jgi:hypothetical protein
MLDESQDAHILKLILLGFTKVNSFILDHQHYKLGKLNQTPCSHFFLKNWWQLQYGVPCSNSLVFRILWSTKYYLGQLPLQVIKINDIQLILPFFLSKCSQAPRGHTVIFCNIFAVLFRGMLCTNYLNLFIHYSGFWGNRNLASGGLLGARMFIFSGLSYFIVPCYVNHYHSRYSR